MGYLVQVRVPFLTAIGMSRSDDSRFGRTEGTEEDELGLELPVISVGPVPEGWDWLIPRGIGLLRLLWWSILRV